MYSEYNPLNRDVVLGVVLCPKETQRCGYSRIIQDLGDDNFIIMTDFGNKLERTKEEIVENFFIEGQQNLKQQFNEQLTLLNYNYVDLFGEVFSYTDVRTRKG